MAVQPWQLEAEPEIHPRAHLEVVAPPPARPSAVMAVAFIVLIGGVIGVPVLKASLANEAPQALGHRPQLPSEMGALDPLKGIPHAGIPRSDRPVGGLVFVSCTRLWTAEPDGSQRRLIVDMPGISSPTFSKDGRTIAFLAEGPNGQDLWLSAADGSERHRVGTLSIAGARPQARATGLAWAPRRDELAFALVSGYYDPWSGGSAIYTFDLSDGRFTSVTAGWPVPSWTDRSVLVARWSDDSDGGASGPRLQSVARDERMRDPIVGTALAGRQTNQGTWWMAPAKAVSIVEVDGVAHLEVRRNWRSRTSKLIDPPEESLLDTRARPAITEDGSKIVVTLIDQSEGDRDVASYDLRSHAWTILDYAWEADVSPVPSSYGPISERRARSLTDTILSYWGYRPFLAQTLMADPSDIGLLSMKSISWMVKEPRRSDSGWVTDALVYGPTPDGFVYRLISLLVTKSGHRMVADILPRGPSKSLRTIQDATRLLSEELGSRFVAPVGLPVGTTLAKWPLDMWSWRGDTTAHLHLRLPGTGGGGGGRGTLTYSYGSEVSLSFGCGGTNHPEETSVGDESGVTDHLGTTSAVVWPATMKDQDGATFGVSGTMSKHDVRALAEALEEEAEEAGT